MTLRRFRLTVLLGLGVLAGAFLPTRLASQVPVRRDTLSGRDTARTRVDTAGGRRNPIPAGRDTLKVPTPAHADSIIRNDSLNKGLVPLPKVVKPDTIRKALARAEAPPVLELGAPRVYDRTALFATGAVTLSDLLARVPGLTEYTTGFLAAPALVAAGGDFRRIRLFLDGVEIDPMDRRARGVAPINDLPIQALEEVRIERGADEVRVYARSWRVDRTDPYTRADVATGDQNTNLYRAYFGRRYDHGETMQVSAEQLNTQPQNQLPSSDGLSVFGRLGLQLGAWNVDASALHISRDRAQWIGTGNPEDQLDTVPQLAMTRTTAYLRFANGDPEAGRWFQFLASSNDYHDKQRQSTAISLSLAPTDTTAVPDSTEYESQYVIAGGITRGVLRASVTDRLRVGGNRAANTVSSRVSSLTGPLSLSLFGETASPLQPSRVEANGRLTLLDRIGLVGSVSRTGAADIDRLIAEPRSGSLLDANNVLMQADTVVTDDTVEVTRYHLVAATNARAEVGIRIRDLWVSAGVIRRGPTTLLPPAELGGVYQSRDVWRTEGTATARTLSVRGRLYRAVYADAWAVAWGDSLGLYRPQYQTRSELYLQTNLLDRFPKGNFGLLTSIAHEYRSSSLFPVDATNNRSAGGYRLLSFKIEIRVQTAVVTYQFRNLLQERYAEIPGFLMARQTQFYGVRWDFWN